MMERIELLTEIIHLQTEKLDNLISILEGDDDEQIEFSSDTDFIDDVK